MSEIVVLYAMLAVLLVIAVAAVCLIFELRRAYAAQKERFSAERFPGLEPELLECLHRIESDANALQKIALQIEAAVAALQEGVSSSIRGSAGRQTRATEGLLDHLDMQEDRLAKTLESISESLRTGPADQTAGRQGREDIDHSRLRRDVLRQGPQVRFSVLKQWIEVNALAILHRASRGWSTVNDLISNIPTYLEPEAEVLNDSILLVGARDHSERLALPLRPLDPSSEFSQWFEPASGELPRLPIPAIVERSAGRLTLMSKGISSPTGLPAA